MAMTAAEFAKHNSIDWKSKEPDPKPIIKHQVGGIHYSEMPIQPIQFITRNRIGFSEGNIIKYACRHRDKGGAEDIRKIIHYCQLILELEYGEDDV